MGVYRDVTEEVYRGYRDITWGCTGTSLRECTGDTGTSLRCTGGTASRDTHLKD